MDATHLAFDTNTYPNSGNNNRNWNFGIWSICEKGRNKKSGISNFYGNGNFDNTCFSNGRRSRRNRRAYRRSFGTTH